MKNRAKFNSRLLYLIAWCTDFILILLVFTVSRDLAIRGVGLLQMGWVGGGFALSGAVSSFFFGQFSDRIGRYHLIRLGVLVLMLGLIGCLFLSPNGWGYYASYFCSAASIGMIYPALFAALTQGKPANQAMRGISRTLIRFCISWNLGLICGQLGGGWIFPFGRVWPIVLGLALTSVDIILVFLAGRNPTLPFLDTEPLNKEDLAQQALGKSFANIAWIANLGGAFSIGIIFHLFPELAVHLGVPSNQHGTILGGMRLVTIATYIFLHHSRFWHYRFSVSLGAHGLALTGLIILCLAKTTSGLFLGLVGVAVSMGYNYFASLFYTNVRRRDDRRGFACGMHEATLGLGFAVGAMGGGIVGAFWGQRSPYLLAIFVILALMTTQIVLYYKWVHPLKKG